jgi:hypothetical protein
MENVQFEKVNFPLWTLLNTTGASSVVEFGAGTFKNFHNVSPDAHIRVGLESWEPYITDPSFHVPGVTRLHCNVMDFEEVLREVPLECCIIFDFLEHLSKEDALILWAKAKKSFSKILLMIPEGVHNQESDVTGMGNHEGQTHRSTWYLEDVKSLEVDEIIVDSNFHCGADKDTGCIFAVWSKK